MEYLHGYYSQNALNHLRRIASVPKNEICKKNLAFGRIKVIHREPLLMVWSYDRPLALLNVCNIKSKRLESSYWCLHFWPTSQCIYSYIHVFASKSWVTTDLHNNGLFHFYSSNFRDACYHGLSHFRVALESHDKCSAIRNFNTFSVVSLNHRPPHTRRVSNVVSVVSSTLEKNYPL